MRSSLAIKGLMLVSGHTFAFVPGEEETGGLHTYRSRIPWELSIVVFNVLCLSRFCCGFRW